MNTQTQTTTTEDTCTSNRKAHLADLKAQLKGHAAETRALRDEARTLTDYDRYSLKAEANDGRSDRRHLHLAYCFLRGRTYNQCEQTCRDNPYRDTIAIKAFKTGVTPDLTALRKDIGMWLDRGNVTIRDLQGDSGEHLKKVEEAEKRLAACQQTTTNSEKNLAAKERAVETERQSLTRSKEALAKAEQELAALKEVA